MSTGRLNGRLAVALGCWLLAGAVIAAATAALFGMARTLAAHVDGKD